MSFWSIIVIVNCPTRWSLLMLIGYWCRSYIIIYFTTQITEKYSTAMCYRCDQPTKPPLRYIPNCCCRKRIEFSSLDSSLVPLWGWILQTVMDFLGTSLQQVKICTHENWEVEIQTLFRKFSKMWVGNEKRCFRSDLHPRLHLCGQHWSLLCRGQGKTKLECFRNVSTHSNLKYWIGTIFLSNGMFSSVMSVS